MQYRLKVSLLFCVFFISLQASYVQAQNIFQGPYIQNVSKTAAVIKWKTFFSSKTKVQYGKTKDMEQVHISDYSVTDHEVSLTNLEPNTKYYYQISYAFFDSHRYKFHTAPLGESEFSFVVMGDTGSINLDQLAIAELLEKYSYDFLLHTGDVVYPDGKESAYDLRFFFPYQKILTKIPFFMTIGNHDAKTNNGAPYLNIFNLPHNNPENSELYYSFEWGNALFISLDSILSPYDEGSTQYNWLVQQLTESKHTWKFVFFHVPLFTSSKRHIDGMREAWAPVFEKYKVDIVFSGHDHYYERLPIQAVNYIISGGGGASINKDREYERHPASVKLLKKHHFLMVDLKPSSIKLRAIDIKNRIIDEFDLQKVY